MPHAYEVGRCLDGWIWRGSCFEQELAEVSETGRQAGELFGQGNCLAGGLLASVVVWLCLLAKQGSSEWAKGDSSGPSEDRGGHAGRDGVDSLSSVGTVWEASSGIRWLLLTIDQGHPSMLGFYAETP